MSTAADEFSLAASVYACYPAEAVTWSLRPLTNSGAGQAWVNLPVELRVEHFALQNAGPHQQVYASEGVDGSQILWEWGQGGATGELEIRTRVDGRAASGVLVCQASQVDAHEHVLADMELRLVISREAHSMKFLPEIYAADDFTQRFMMLFESFWKPLSQQINQIPEYFDPYLTTPEMLPWLASWFGLEWDAALPEDRKRDLLARIFPIYAHKGTGHALVLFLKMFTGGEVEITEHRDTNFVLGQAACLGYQVALGTKNSPHSFDVRLRVPAAAARSGEMTRAQYRQRIEAMINQYKPAQTVFHLDLEFV